MTLGCGGRLATDDPFLIGAQETTAPEERLPPPLVVRWRLTPRPDTPLPRFPPALGRDHVLVGFEDGVEAYRLVDGSLAWLFRAGDEVRLPPLPAGDQAVVATATALRWLDATDGRSRGRRRLESPPRAAAWVPRGPVVADDGEVVQHAPTEVRWRQPLSGSTAIVPSPDGRTLYISTAGGLLRALSADDGRPVWSVNLPDGRLTAAAVAEGRVFVAGTHQQLVALDALTGEVVWRRFLGADVVGAPAVVDELVWVAGLDALLQAFRVDNGTLLYSLPLPSRNYLDLAASPPWVVVGPRYGPWTAVRPPIPFSPRASPVRTTALRGENLTLPPAAGRGLVALVNGDGSLALLQPRPDPGVPGRALR